MAAAAAKSDLRTDYEINGTNLKKILGGNGIGFDVAVESYVRYAIEPELAAVVWADIRDVILELLNQKNSGATRIVAEYTALPAVALAVAADKEVLAAVVKCAGPTSC